MRTLAITHNVTGWFDRDLGNWFDAQGQGDVDQSDLLKQLHRESAETDALLVGRHTFEDMRSYWPQQTDDTTGVTAHLNQVAKYVASSTMSDPGWQAAPSSTATSSTRFGG